MSIVVLTAQHHPRWSRADVLQKVHEVMKENANSACAVVGILRVVRIQTALLRIVECHKLRRAKPAVFLTAWVT